MRLLKKSQFLATQQPTKIVPKIEAIHQSVTNSIFDLEEVFFEPKVAVVEFQSRAFSSRNYMRDLASWCA